MTSFYVYLSPGNEFVGHYTSHDEAQAVATRYNQGNTIYRAFVSYVWINKQSNPSLWG